MPELPEVETTRRGIAPHLEGHRIDAVIVREPRLRWPVPADIAVHLNGAEVTAVRRRAKYLLLHTANRRGEGAAMLHLGMSGSLRLVPGARAPGRHDHVDMRLDSGLVLRLTDPRRFGSLHWIVGDPAAHPLLASLGPEPLSDAFSGATLRAAARGRRTAVKALIMNARVVVGVGNIYASEALFRAGIHPRRPAGHIGAARMDVLAGCIRDVLGDAIAQGGTTLRDFTAADGRPGYFRQHLQVYARGGEPCPRCTTPLRQAVIGQRSTFFCPRCQR